MRFSVPNKSAHMAFSDIPSSLLSIRIVTRIPINSRTGLKTPTAPVRQTSCGRNYKPYILVNDNHDISEDHARARDEDKRQERTEMPQPIVPLNRPFSNSGSTDLECDVVDANESLAWRSLSMCLSPCARGHRSGNHPGARASMDGLT